MIMVGSQERTLTEPHMLWDSQQWGEWDPLMGDQREGP